MASVDDSENQINMLWPKVLNFLHTSVIRRKVKKFYSGPNDTKFALLCVNIRWTKCFNTIQTAVTYRQNFLILRRLCCFRAYLRLKVLRWHQIMSKLSLFGDSQMSKLPLFCDRYTSNQMSMKAGLVFTGADWNLLCSCCTCISNFRQPIANTVWDGAD